jgi:hypothetical protein
MLNVGSSPVMASIWMSPATAPVDSAAWWAQTPAGHPSSAVVFFHSPSVIDSTVAIMRSFAAVNCAAYSSAFVPIVTSS